MDIISFASTLRDRLRLIALIRFFNRMIRRLSRFAHRVQYMTEWELKNPEYFEHQMDLNWKWHQSQTAYPMERGVFSSFALSNDVSALGKTLDLCSGDGFYSYYFYSKRSSSVISIDFDPHAIKFAQKNYGHAKNIDFQLGDIRRDIPDGPFDNIIWDAAIEHFTEMEIAELVARIKSVLKIGGVLSGYTIVEAGSGIKHLHQHEYEFHNKEDLVRFLKPHFKKVHVFSTTYPDRTNLYFYATDGLLPFETSDSVVVAD